MSVKVSFAVEGARRSLLSDRLAVTANRSHVAVDIHGERQDLVSLRIDRDALLDLIRAGFKAGMFEAAG